MEAVTGIGIFVGLVAGVIVQVIANWITVRRQQSNARDVFKVELQINYSALEGLESQLDRLKTRISSGQVNSGDLHISMMDFDYSAMGPLIQSGHFHKILGTEGVKRYFSVVRFFNNESAAWLTQELQNAHDTQNSVNFIEALSEKKEDAKKALKETTDMLV